MTDSNLSAHRKPAAWTALLLGALVLLLAPARDSEAKEWDSVKNNVALAICEDPVPWEWISSNPAWAKSHIVKGARRELKKLKSREPTNGQGALLHLAILDAEEDMTLDNLAEKLDHQGLLLQALQGFRGRRRERDVRDRLRIQQRRPPGPGTQSQGNGPQPQGEEGSL